MRVSLLFLTLTILFSRSHGLTQTIDSNNLITITYDGNHLWCAVAEIEQSYGNHGQNVIEGRGGGVVRWDPVSEDYILFQSPEPLIKNDVHKIVTDGNGRIWLRYDQSNQITGFDGTDWTHYQLTVNVNDIAVGGEGTLWAATNEGLYSLADSGWVAHTLISTLLTQEIIITKPELLTVGGSGRLIVTGGSPTGNDGLSWGPVTFRLEDDDWIYIFSASSMILNVCASENDDIWFLYSPGMAGLNTSLFLNSNSTNIIYNYPHHALSDVITEYISPCVFDENNTAWVLFKHHCFDPPVTQVVSFDDSTYNVYAPEEAPPFVCNEWVYDSAGIKWIATQEGLVRYDGTSYRTVIAPPKVAEDPKPLPMELKAYPNPFNNEVTVLVNLDSGAFTELSVYSINGQKIRTIAETTLSAGQHTFKWDGRDDSGGTVSSGIYMIRMNTDANGITRKVVFLK